MADQATTTNDITDKVNSMTVNDTTDSPIDNQSVGSDTITFVQ
jgi:hypothetical protein